MSTDAVRSEVDREALTMTFVTEYDLPPEHVWQVWADPRRLSGWWGPPTWPASFDRHELVEGSRSTYAMTELEPQAGSPGQTSRGWWRIGEVDAPRRFAFVDGFADESGEPDDSLPTCHIVVTLAALDGGGTRMTTVTTFGSREALDELLEMGMEDGMRLAMGQIPGVLRAG